MQRLYLKRDKYFKKSPIYCARLWKSIKRRQTLTSWLHYILYGNYRAARRSCRTTRLREDISFCAIVMFSTWRQAGYHGHKSNSRVGKTGRIRKAGRERGTGRPRERAVGTGSDEDSQMFKGGWRAGEGCVCRWFRFPFFSPCIYTGFYGELGHERERVWVSERDTKRNKSGRRG